MPYNAGTIFLQVVPVFGDVQNAISRKAKEMDKALGDELENAGHNAGRRASEAIGEELEKGASKGGERAGKKYSGAFINSLNNAVREAGREIDAIKLRTDDTEAKATLKELKKELRSINRTKIKPEMDIQALLAKIATAEAAIKSLQDSGKVDVEFNLQKMLRDLGKVKKLVESVHPKIEPELDTKPIERQLGAFERKLRATAKKAADNLGDSANDGVKQIKAALTRLGDAQVGVDITSERAVQEIRSLYLQLQALSANDVDIDVDIDIATAMAELSALDVAVGKLDGRSVSIDVDTKDVGAAVGKMGALAAIMSLFRGRQSSVAAGGQEVANSFRAFNGVVLASVTLLPALVPVLAAVGGGLLALLPILAAVTAGVATMIIGFSGIGGAVSALGDAQDSAASDSRAAAKTMSDAADQVAAAQTALARAEQQAGWARADAARAVADAREAAADAIEDALKRQEDAQKDYARAVRDVRQAEKDLAEARREAAKDLLDLDNSISQNQIDIGQGVIDEFNAQANYNAVMTDGSSTNQEKDAALLQLQEAQLKLKQLREEQAQMAAEKAQADKTGLEGTKKVKDAQDALTTQLEQQADAQKKLKEAAQDVTDARVDGAKAIRDAERNAARVAITSAQSVSDAKKALAAAEKNYADALYQTGEVGSAAMQKLQQEMDKLGPAGQKFARFIFSLRKGWYQFRSDIQEAFLPPIQKALESFIDTYGSRMTRFFVRMAKATGRLFGDLGKALEGPVFQRFFAMMDRFGPRLMRQFGKTAIVWLKIFAKLAEIAAPYALKLSKALARMSRELLNWLKSKEGTETVQKFLDYAVKVGPKVLSFFLLLGAAFVNIMEALAPWGELVLGALDAFLKFIADMDPKTLGLVLGLIISMVIAFQLAQAAVFLTSVAFTALLSAAGFWVALAVLTIGALTALYIRYENVRKVINFVASAWWSFAKIMFNFYKMIIGAVASAIVWFVTNIFLPYWAKIGPVVTAQFKLIWWAWQNILWPVLKAIGKAAMWLWENAIKPAFKAIWSGIKTAFSIIKTVWNNILWPVLDLIGTVVWKLFKAYWKPAIDGAKSVWEDFVTGAKFVWNKYLKPLLDDIVDTVLPAFQSAWETTIDAIGKAWGFLKKYVAEPIFTIIDLIINKGIIDGFNTIAKFVGSDPMTHISLPFTDKGEAVKKATGGVLPGYSPGVDNHKFYSPTAGRLELSGGEAIMRPEWTAAMGSGYIDQMNKIARTGGVRGVQKAMQFAKGGIVFPVPNYGGKKPYIEMTAYNMGHDGVDINHPLDGGPNGTGGVVPFLSATSGYVTRASMGDYGNAVGISSPYGSLIYGHGYPGSLRVKVGDTVSPGTMLGLIGMTAGQTPVSGPHLHFGRPGGTFQWAYDLLRGSAHLAGSGGGKVVEEHNYPAALAKIIKEPLDWAKGLIAGPLEKFQGVYSNPFAQMIGDIPGKLVSKMADKAISMIPGKEAFNKAGELIKDGAGAVGDVVGGIGDAVGLRVAARNGGILPYNGTMKYDSGGYLPPGLTSVVNLTGRPEPVFTDGQFDKMRSGDGESWTYAPTFEGSNLTAQDVGDDLEFRIRKIRTQGRYARNR